jgi:hypothetical protein
MTPEQMALAKRYSDAERAARGRIAPVWDAIRHALAEERVLAQRVESGDLQEMADYHAANLDKLGGHDAQLRGLLAGSLQLIEAMQAASVAQGENLFPGVQVTNAPE